METNDTFSIFKYEVFIIKRSGIKTKQPHKCEAVLIYPL